LQTGAGTQLGIDVRGDGGLRAHHGPEAHLIQVAIERVAPGEDVAEPQEIMLAAEAQGVRAVVPGIGQPLGPSKRAVDVKAGIAKQVLI